MSSPAYDLITPAGRERLVGSHPHNVVRLILPLAGPASDGTANATARSADTLRRWQEEGVLVRDTEPGLWLYELRPASGPTTSGWLGAVALPPAGSTAVLPHEDTYPVAVEGRRALLAATATDLEPIILAHDPEPEVSALTDELRTGDPAMTVRDTDGVAHRLWRVTDGRLVDRLIGALARTEAVIADGHHRFAAARANQRSGRRAGSDRVLALLTPMGPGGLRVDPIHRVVPRLELHTAVAAAATGFAATDVAAPAGVGDAIRAWMAGPAEGDFLVTDGHRLVRLSDPSAQVRADVPSDAPPAWRGLDVVLAHHGLIDGLWHRPDDADSVLIAHSVDEALRLAGDGAGVALLLRAPSPGDVAAVARAGVRMPRKSTLFVPKPRTGLVLRPLAD